MPRFLRSLRAYYTPHACKLACIHTQISCIQLLACNWLTLRTHAHTHTHTHVHIVLFGNIYTYMYIYIYTHMHIYTYTCIHVYHLHWTRRQACAWPLPFQTWPASSGLLPVRGVMRGMRQSQHALESTLVNAAPTPSSSLQNNSPVRVHTHNMRCCIIQDARLDNTTHDARLHHTTHDARPDNTIHDARLHNTT